MLFGKPNALILARVTARWNARRTARGETPARKHAAYWSGGQPGSTAGNAIRDGGWHARNLDVRAEVRALSASAA